MAAQQSISLTKAPPIQQPRKLQQPGLHLFKPGFEYQNIDIALPFVERKDGETNYWVVPAETKESLRKADEFGRRAAAAYAIYVMRNGPADVQLNWIAEAQTDATRSTSMAFWSHLSRLLYLYGHHITAEDITSDVEAVIEEYREYDRMDADSLKADMVA